MPSTKRKPKAVEEVNTDPVCRFCLKPFKSENNLAKHVCEKKKRFLSKDDKPERFAFRVFQRFYEINTRSKKAKTQEDFIQSPAYGDFLKVGKYITDINPVNVMQYVDFLVKSGLPVKRWTTPHVYETYLRELTRNESPDAAVERNILLMQQWANETGNHWTDFFRMISPAQATQWIINGRISPWVIFISSSGGDMLNRMSDEQIGLVGSVLDPTFWGIRQDKHREEVIFFRELLDNAGV